MNVHELLHKIQQNLKTTKDRYNEFGGFSYRSYEDIVEAVKPFLAECGATIHAPYEMVQVGERYYAHAQVYLMLDGEKSEIGHGWAREAEGHGKMDDMQLTGSTASYSRKYGGEGLFGIDNNKDADATNTYGSRKTATDEVHFKRKVQRCLECYGDIEGLRAEAAKFKDEAAELGESAWLVEEYRTQEARINHELMDKEGSVE